MDKNQALELLDKLLDLAVQKGAYTREQAALSHTVFNTVATLLNPPQKSEATVADIESTSKKAPLEKVEKE